MHGNIESMEAIVYHLVGLSLKKHRLIYQDETTLSLLVQKPDCSIAR